MTAHRKNIEIQNRDETGFDAVIKHDPATCHVCEMDRRLADYIANGTPTDEPKAPETTPTGHVCLVPGCGVFLDPENYFCEYHFEKIPDDLLGAWLNCNSEDEKSVCVKKMADHLSRQPESLIAQKRIADFFGYYDAWSRTELGSSQERASLAEMIEARQEIEDLFPFTKEEES